MFKNVGVPSPWVINGGRRVCYATSAKIGPPQTAATTKAGLRGKIGRCGRMGGLNLAG
jgi:hypothetical protein